MPNLEPPNNSEIARLLEKMSDQLVDIAHKMDEQRAENARTYLRADVYVSERKLLEATDADLHRDIGKVDMKVENRVGSLETRHGSRILAIETDRKEDVKWRRQASLMVGICIVGSIISIAGLILNFTAR